MKRFSCQRYKIKRHHWNVNSAFVTIIHLEAAAIMWSFAIGASYYRFNPSSCLLNTYFTILVYYTHCTILNQCKIYTCILYFCWLKQTGIYKKIHWHSILHTWLVILDYLTCCFVFKVQSVRLKIWTRMKVWNLSHKSWDLNQENVHGISSHILRSGVCKVVIYKLDRFQIPSTLDMFIKI